ncbi:MAG: alpha-mannosidase [Acutalibacteraceae bacterium]
MMLNDLTTKKIEKMLSLLKEQITPVRIKIDGVKTKECGYKTDNNVPTDTDSWASFGEDESWGMKPEEHRWFYFRLKIPQELKGADTELYIASTDMYGSHWNPQFLLYINGKLIRGMDSNHRYVKIDSTVAEYDIHVYAYSMPQGEKSEFHCELCVFQRDVERLFFNIVVPFEALVILDKQSKDYNTIKTYMHEAVNMLDWRRPGEDSFIDSVKRANEFLKNEFYKKECYDNGELVSCIGHTHIDVAWRWTYDQSKEKVQRTFSTVVEMMKEYPEYKFMSSQPQLFEFLKQEAPEVYADIKELVRQGRIEPEGGMWLEADCNLISGESFVRQFLFGKRFFKEEFDKDNHILWLPDVFGYSASMPQILRKCGIDTFVTSKISWNEFNRMPYDNFNWYGIDGTPVFVAFMTAVDIANGDFERTSYTPRLNTSHTKGSYERYEPKELNSNTLLTFGQGDGGGGPVDDDIEYYERMKYGIPGMPMTKIEFAGDYLDRVRSKLENDPRLPKWVGELYLEFHRGTYTSVAKNKKNNRKSEILYQNAEAMAYTAKLLTGAEYDQETLNSGWKLILLNQFHDILPGSSIKSVYDKCDEDYAEIFDKGNTVLNGAYDAIVNNIKTDGGLVVFNPNSFEDSAAVEYGGKMIYAENIPPKGYRVIKPEQSKAEYSLNGRVLETKYYIVEFAEDYTISRLYDKENDCEVLRDGGRGNVIQAYEDYPYEHDAWELSNYYEEKYYEINSVESVQPFDEGERFGIIVKRKFLDSDFEQKICFYNHSRRIDFITLSDWKQEHYMVKAAFDTDINTNKAVYDIQFGHIERPTHRNTSWDAAKFEVCAHKFMDMSEYGYGVSLLNDCKYGHNVKDGTMKLSLFKCATHPDPDADKILHSFTYSLYPHSGDFREAGTIKQAYSLNNPMQVFEIGKQEGSLPEEFSFVKCSAENFIIETIKKAEDSDSLIIRGYESWNKRTSVRLDFGFDVSSACLCGALEDELEPLTVNSNSLSFKAKPFEIITVKINLKF